MIRAIGVQQDGTFRSNLSIEEIKQHEFRWFWADFSEPTSEEKDLFSTTFHFHPLAIEDCLEKGHQRPKMDDYNDYLFLLIHSLAKKSYDARKLNLFMNEKMLVTFHYEHLQSVEDVFQSNANGLFSEDHVPLRFMHAILDRIVDEYFPYVYGIEDHLNNIEERTDENATYDVMDRLFDVRHDMQKIRRSLIPQRDVLYRLLNSVNISLDKEQQFYFQDIYDHVIKLVEMLESYREFSSDIRDNYISVSSDKMNNIMMTLTVITTIFMPLTFIAGLYGMNFINIPELEFQNGYFVVLGVMGFIAIVMFLVFRKIGWLRFSRSHKKRRRRIFLR
ncbi:magnesium/cobalt transporter CorA [Jeotgalibacillus proteolyticus]|uniref:Magnesium transport protein CorA n=1 Tax=Jeotgalibacillus proteolyticus TaxID=2082395 RepID=A0A2S5GH43_9BACL|nr:magnesium/cobalt transporter CorA [Jeotgalibacillus proteolyticus]PPA72225.1 magnesium and cobalt transport protein CorA [Jeotgalibacillus proteolyticus]